MSIALDPKHTTLSSLLSKIRDVIEYNFGSEWVSAEIADIKKRNGHLYLSLTEHDEQGKKKAVCSGTIWSSVATTLENKFSQITGSNLSANMKILVKAIPRFHASYGFSLNIIDIDPAYTLGDIAKKLAEIRQKLKDNKCYDNQKNMSMPFDYTRVAVLSPDNAAGLGDFQREANILCEKNLVHFDYFGAYFQGENARDSIMGQLRTIFKINRETPYDCLVIIRGGGAVIDLNYLNEYDIAFAITQFKLPVFTGIGHKKDSTILDEVAHYAFDTPSKVVLHIRHSIEKNALQAEKDIHQIYHSTISKLNAASQVLEQTGQIANTAPFHILNQAQSNIKISFESIHRLSGNQCQKLIQTIQTRHHQTVNHFQLKIAEASENYQAHSSNITVLARRLIDFNFQRLTDHHQSIYRDLSNKISSLQTNMTSWFTTIPGHTKHQISYQESAFSMIQSTLIERLHYLISRTEDKMNNFYQVIDIASPQNTLKRGFSILRSTNGMAITDKAKALEHNHLQVELRDGALNVKIEESQ